MKLQNHTPKKALLEDQHRGLFHRFSPRLLWIVIPASLVIAGLVVYASRVHSGSGKTTVRAASSSFDDAVATKSNTTRSGHAKSRQWNWPVDGQATYQVCLSQVITPGKSNIRPASCGRTEISGKLHVCFLDGKADSITLAMQFSDATVELEPTGGKTVNRQPVIENMLNSNPGLVRYDRDGRLLACKLPAALADSDRAMLKSLFAPEFVLGDGSQWEAEEKIQGLSCRSAYSTETGTRFTKTRRALEAPKGQPSLNILNSKFTAVPGAFWIESLEGAEKMDYSWKAQAICRVETSTKLVRQKETSVPDSLLVFIRDTARQEALIDSGNLTSGDEDTRKSAIERQKMAGLIEKYQAVPASSMIDDLSKVVAGAKDHKATIPAMYALRDWLLANPKRSGEIAEALKKPELNGPVAARMLHALELAGQKNMESQSALSSIISAAPGTYDPSVLMQAIVAAGGVGSIQCQDLVTALSNMAAAENPLADYSLCDGALYALGALARENPSLQQSLVDTLSPWLATDGSIPSADAATALRTLANARNQDPSILEKARTLSSQHQDPEVRMATIDYFASLGTPEAIQFIGQVLRNDTSANVRQQSVSALTSPELISHETLSPVIDMVSNTTTPAQLRDFALKRLGQLDQAEFPEIQRAIAANP